MRQLGVATHLYANDNNDYVPGDTFGQGYFFASMLAPYVSQVRIEGNKVFDSIYLHTNYSRIGVYQCPSFRSTRPTAARYTLHYTINSIDLGQYAAKKTYAPGAYQKLSSLPVWAQQGRLFCRNQQQRPVWSNGFRRVEHLGDFRHRF